MVIALPCTITFRRVQLPLKQGVNFYRLSGVILWLRLRYESVLNSLVISFYLSYIYSRISGPVGLLFLVTYSFNLSQKLTHLQTHTLERM